MSRDWNRWRPRSDSEFWASFWGRVEKTDSCWLWNGFVGKWGYGLVTWMGREHRVHRLVFERLVGAIPAGLHILHRCDVRNCVNPAHLFAGTNYDNAMDRVAKGRTRNRYSGKTRCSKGHEWQHIWGRRLCLICRNEWQRRYRRKRKEAALVRQSVEYHAE